MSEQYNLIFGKSLSRGLDLLALLILGILAVSVLYDPVWENILPLITYSLYAVLVFMAMHFIMKATRMI